MLKLTAAALVAFLSLGAAASHIELVCYKKAPGDPTWRSYGGNPVGCWGQYPNTPAGAHRCAQDRQFNLEYLEQNHGPGEFQCQCVTVGNPYGDPPGGGGEEGYQ